MCNCCKKKNQFLYLVYANFFLIPSTVVKFHKAKREKRDLLNGLCEFEEKVAAAQEIRVQRLTNLPSESRKKKQLSAYRFCFEFPHSIFVHILTAIPSNVGTLVCETECC